MKTGGTEGWELKWEVMRLEFQFQLISCYLVHSRQKHVYSCSGAQWRAGSTGCLPTLDLLVMLHISFHVLRFDFILALHTSRFWMFVAELATEERASFSLG